MAAKEKELVVLKALRKPLPTTTIRLRADYVKWIKEHEEDLNCLITGEKVIISAHRRIKKDH